MTEVCRLVCDFGFGVIHDSQDEGPQVVWKIANIKTGRGCLGSEDPERRAPLHACSDCGWIIKQILEMLEVGHCVHEGLPYVNELGEIIIS